MTVLPDPDEKVRCAAFTTDVGLDPAGTALCVDEFVLVDVALPWPKPVFARPGLEVIAAAMADAAENGRRVRVLASVPTDADRPARVSHHVRSGGGFVGTDLTLAAQVDDAHLGRIVAAIVGGRSDGSGIEGVDAVQPRSSATRELWVCTQGSHDVCCGSRGTELWMALRDRAPDLVVRKVSHTGGHRFAPTAVSMPDGRMWGRLDANEAVAVATRSGSPAEVAARGRGWVGVESGPAQVAEAAVWTVLDDWVTDERERTVRVADPVDGVHRCEVRVDERRWEVEVVAGREVPTITCGAVGGLPTKPGVEWSVRSLRQVG